MAFEHGSQAISVRNPFRVEGAFYLARAALLMGFGFVLALGLKESVGRGSGGSAWAQLLLAITFLILGFSAAWLGIAKLFRFFVGRSAPSDQFGDAEPGDRKSTRLNSSHGYN